LSIRTGTQLLHQAIRLALGDDSDSPRFIEQFPNVAIDSSRRAFTAASPADGVRRPGVGQHCSRPAPQPFKRARTAGFCRCWLVAAYSYAIVLAVAHLTKTTRATRQQRRRRRRVDAGRSALRLLNREEAIGHLAIAIPDAITARWPEPGQIRVRPTSAVLIRYAQARVADVAGVLGAEYLLTGTLQEIGDNLRVNAAVGSRHGHGFALGGALMTCLMRAF